MADTKDTYRQDHAKMRAAAELPFVTSVEESPEREPIPGEHDHGAEAHTQPAIVGTTGYGGDLPPDENDPTLDEKTREERAWEGGGLITGQREKGKGKRT